MPQLLHAALECADFTVEIAGTCNDAREALSLVPHDAAVLDLGLPDGGGMPILILTARNSVEHRVGGLDAGADD
jgi:DNA-binding response OmpR family regulator